MRRKLLTWALATGFAGAALASSIVTGDLLAVDQEAGTSQQGALFIVDQGTGTRTLFSDFGNSSQGVQGVDPNSVAWAQAKLLGLLPISATALVTDGSGGTNEQGALYQVDPNTGNRTLFSDFGNSAQGPLGEYPLGVLTVAPSLLNWWSGVLVVDPFAGSNGQGAIFSIDASGNRTTVIDFGDSNGPQGQYPDSMAYFPGLLGLGSTVLVADGSAGTNQKGALFSIDPATGTRTLLSDFGSGAQGWVDPGVGSTPVGVIVSPSGQIFVLLDELASGGGGKVVRVDPATGIRTLTSDLNDTTEGSVGVSPEGLVWLPSHGLIGVSDGDAGPEGSGAILTINPQTGLRGMLSDFGNGGQGPLGNEPSGAAVAQ